MRAAVVKKDSLAAPRKRGSQSGVKRGNYKPRRTKPPEPQTPEELAALQKRCREFWGDETFDANYKVFSREHGRFVSVRTYVPDDRSTPELDKYDTEVTSKTCRGCGLDLDLSCFSPSKTGAHGVGGKCKSCRAEDARDYASTPKGKTARARAQARFRAAEKAQERQVAVHEAWIETLKKTPAGRERLSDLERRISLAKDSPLFIEIGYPVWKTSVGGNQ